MTDEEHREFVKAYELIASLKVGDRVRVTRPGGTYDRVVMTVSQGPRRSGGQFGSPESLHVTVTFGPGRYAFEVGVDHLWRRRWGHAWIGGGTTLEKITEGADRIES